MTVVATSHCVAGIITTLCDAFADDPGLGWIWPDRDERLARLPHFFAAIVGGTVANGVVFRSAGTEAVSLWRRPGRIQPDEAEIGQALPAMREAFVTGGERSRLMGATLRAHQQDGDWWYLQFIGVATARQGAGLGAAVIRAGLDLAAKAGQPIHVEVMNPDNLRFYHRAGFRIVEEFDLPDDGPHVWAMRLES